MSFSSVNEADKPSSPITPIRPKRLIYDHWLNMIFLIWLKMTTR